LLLELRASALVRKLDEPGRKRLQALLPPLLADVARAPTAESQLQVLRRVLRIIEAIGQRDYPIVQGVTLAFGIAVMLINLIVDCSYGFFDPRVSVR